MEIHSLLFGCRVYNPGQTNPNSVSPLAGDRAEGEVFVVFFGQSFDLGDDLERVQGGAFVLLVLLRGFTLQESEGPSV